MISTLTIGKEASVYDFAPKLKVAPFDVLLVMMTPHVTSKNPDFRLLTFLANTNFEPPEWAIPHLEDVFA